MGLAARRPGPWALLALAASVLVAAPTAIAQCQGHACSRPEKPPPARPNAAQPRPASPLPARPTGPPARPYAAPAGARPPAPARAYAPQSRTVSIPDAQPGRTAPAQGRAFTDRGRSFAAVRAAPYRYPRGYAYRPYRAGERFPLALLVPAYLITDFALYDLSPPAPALQWVRYGPDALLVNVDTGQVVDVAYGVFDEDPGYADNAPPPGSDDPNDAPPPGYPPPPIGGPAADPGPQA